MSRTTERRLERGVTLVELIVFIVIVSTAVAGVLMTLDLSNRSSTDPMIQKQALAIAEALLEEVQLQPFTYCDPDDPRAATALSATYDPVDQTNTCSAAAAIEAMDAETNAPYGPEARSSTTKPFDNVNDYNGFCMGPGSPACPVATISDLDGNSRAGLEAYRASVEVVTQALGGIADPSDSLRITVTVTGPANTTVVLQGYRVRYAPNAVP
jgi:MSHA pilin protein MshD